MWLGGANWEFSKCKGGQSVYNVLTFQKSRGQELTPRPPPNETLACVCFEVLSVVQLLVLLNLQMLSIIYHNIIIIYNIYIYI